jgi:hypothetical protein
MEDRRAIDERKAVIESRARAVVAVGLGEGAVWMRQLGEPPHDPTKRERWVLAAASVAAYRDRYKITSDLPLAGGAANDAQRADRQRAQAALREAAAVSSASRHESRSRAPGLRAVSGP